MDRFARLAEILDEVPPGDAATQASWLEKACDGDLWLQAEAARLLQHETAVPRGFLSPPSQTSRARSHPEVIGPYRVVRHVGSGGMGAVYEATDPDTGRRVAVKVIRSDAPSDELLIRFEAERRTLARMDHEGVARVFHAGRTDGGEPYLAMEFLTDAVDLVTWRRTSDPGPRATIEVFVRVCDAVQHAHQKGIVHRDLKPGNIVVVTDPASGEARPKVIDFGVARLAGEAAENDLRTRLGQMIGTGPYMAPEQERDPSSADVRSDVFALGAVLYELLSGGRAFESAGRPAVRPMARVREDQPLSPPGPVPADLELIVMKAINLDPEVRYPTAEALAADLRRWLADEPVLARPPSILYRARKFVARNRAAVAAGGAGLVLVGVLVGLMIDQARRSAATEADLLSSTLVTAASQAIGLQDGRSAVGFLERVPERRRGWEWRYLRVIADQPALTVMSPRGRALAVVAGAGEVPLFLIDDPEGAGDPGDLEPLGHARMVAARGLAGDRRRSLVWGGRRLHVIDTASGTIERRLEAPAGVEVVAADLRGERVVFLGDDRRLHRRELDDPAGTWRSAAVAKDAGVDDPRAALVQLELLPPGENVILMGTKVAVLVGLESGIVRRDLRADGDPDRLALAVSPDGTRLARPARLGGIRIENLLDGGDGHSIVGIQRPVSSVAFDATGTRIVAGSKGGSVHLASVHDEAFAPPRLGHAGPVTGIAFGGDGRLHTTALDGTLRTWDPEVAVVGERSFDLEAPVLDLAFHPDGTLIVVASGNGIRRWDPSTPGAPPRPMPTVAGDEADGGDAYRIAPLDGTGGLAVGRTDGGVSILGAEFIESSVPVPALDAPRFVNGLAASPGGRWLVATAHDDDQAALLDAATGAVIERWDLGSAAADWASSDTVVLAGPEMPLLIRRVSEHGRVRDRSAVPGTEGWTVVATPDGRSAFVGTKSGDIVHVDLATGEIVRSLLGHGQIVLDLAVSPDGSRLVSASQDGTVRLWSVKAGVERFQLRHDDTPVMSVAFSRDGHRIAAGSAGRRLIVWGD